LPRIALLEGRPVSDLCDGNGLLEQVAQAVADDAAPLDDIRGSADFRREITVTLARRALRKALDRAVERVQEGKGGQ